MIDELKLDQKCLNCSPDVEHNIKLFKVACLAYQPSSVNYRKQNFTKQQLMAVRKFLVGQTAQLILSSPSMKRMNLCSKKVFDDIYIHLENQAKLNNNISEEAAEQFKLIESEHDSSNQMRSILFKTKDVALNMMEMSLQGSHEYSNFNTCQDYLESSRTQRNKYQPMR